MVNEIGSEFWDVPVLTRETNCFPVNSQWFLSGRSALKSIIAELTHCRSVALPSWCCDSMIKPFRDAGMRVCFYPVWFDKGLKRSLRCDADALLLMDYFGYSSEEPGITGYGGVLIRDITHSFLTKRCDDADYYFGSLRKWCGVWTGGYAYAADGHPLRTGGAVNSEYAAARSRAMELKASYLRGESAGKTAFLSLFAQAEELLEKADVCASAQRDILLARRLDADTIKERRRQNARVLMDALGEILMFPELKRDDCPMMAPILVPNGKRDALRRFLIENNVYCPVHWPLTSMHETNARTRYIYENELSLVCDQRYSPVDMEREAELVKQFWKEKV